MKILGAVWSHQLNSTANPAHLPQNWAKLAKSTVLFSWYLQTAPRILIFSIAMGAEYLSYVKFIATRAPTFFGYTISVLANVMWKFLGKQDATLEV